jgi:hypothetical protein
MIGYPLRVVESVLKFTTNAPAERFPRRAARV